jgi:hypothetical protein
VGSRYCQQYEWRAKAAPLHEPINPLAVAAYPLAVEMCGAAAVKIPHCRRHVDEASGGLEGTVIQKIKSLPGGRELKAIASDLRNHFLGHVDNSSIVEKNIVE